MAEKKTIMKGMYNWTFLAIVIAAIVLINIISSFVSKRWDVTEDQRYSLSEGTIDYLSNKKSFKNRISIRIYFDGNLPSELKHFRNSIEDKLKEFKEYKIANSSVVISSENYKVVQVKKNIDEYIAGDWTNKDIIPMERKINLPEPKPENTKKQPDKSQIITDLFCFIFI